MTFPQHSYLDVIKPKSETISTVDIVMWLELREAHYYKIAMENDRNNIDVINRAKSAAFREAIEHILT